MHATVLLVMTFAWATNALAQQTTQHADTGATHTTIHHQSNARLNIGAGVSSLYASGRTSTMPTLVGIVRVNHKTEVEVEGGYWANTQDHCTERASALIASLHREVRGPWGITAGALVENTRCHDESEREVGLVVGPSLTLQIKKIGIILAPGLAWTRNNDGEQTLGLHTGIMLRTWR